MFDRAVLGVRIGLGGGLGARAAATGTRVPAASTPSGCCERPTTSGGGEGHRYTRLPFPS
eukprot:12927200-Prorocentrum_lima.AAC.1